MNLKSTYQKGADFVEKGGLAQLHSAKGTPRLAFALDLLGKHQTEPTYFLWVSDEGYLFPETLSRRTPFPLQHFVLAKVPSAADVWKVTLEGIQSGLFGWIFLRSSRGCPPAFLRKLQLQAERSRARVVIVCEEKLPHYLIKTSWELDNEKVSLPASETLRRESR